MLSFAGYNVLIKSLDRGDDVWCESLLDTCRAYGKYISKLNTARVTTDPACANNVRSNPGTANQLLFQVQPGESFEIIGGPRCADGFVWWQIRRNGRTGWMVEGTATEAWIERVNNQSANQSESEIAAQVGHQVFRIRLMVGCG
jgi:hypothetical protein